jgi:hypothetical protein
MRRFFWKAILNRIDRWDNKTVLDYVDSEIVRNAGSDSEKVLRGYRVTLESAGAKRRGELEAVAGR